jgi:predicted dehydrogenase
MPEPGQPVRVGVVGVGHLGRHHVRLLAGHAGARLVAAADVDKAALQRARQEHGVEGFTDYRALCGRVDAVCVVVPTSKHREVAGHFLEHGIDVLVEKPLAPTAVEAGELVALAQRHDRILQVGHIERFNSALRAIANLDLRPRYLEAERLAPFSFRSTDIGVVLDLMIHDIDLVLALTGSAVASLDAFGGGVFTTNEDMASALLRLRNGAVAHLTANRVALKPVRKLRMFSPDCYASLDFTSGKGTVIRKQPGWDLQKLDVGSVDRTQDLWRYVFEGLLTVNEYKLDEGNPLLDELSAFLDSVVTRKRPLVSGAEGLAAVEVATRVLDSIHQHRW